MKRQILAVAMILMLFSGVIVYAQESNETTSNETSNQSTVQENQTIDNPSPTSNETIGSPDNSTQGSNTTVEPEEDEEVEIDDDKNEDNSTQGENGDNNIGNSTSNQTQTNQTTQPPQTNSTNNQTTKDDIEEKDEKKNKSNGNGNNKGNGSAFDKLLDLFNKTEGNQTPQANNTMNTPQNNTSVETSRNNTTIIENITEPVKTGSVDSSSSSETKKKEDLYIEEPAVIDVEEVTSIDEPQEDVRVSVLVLEHKPDVLPQPPGFIYQYLEMKLISGNQDEYEIKFKVSKQWLDENYVSKETIRLHRYTDKWEELETEVISEDADYIYYKSKTPGFSYFAISGEKKYVDASVGKWALITMISVAVLISYIYKKISHGFSPDLEKKK